MTETKPEGLPFRPGDWVADQHDNVARVRSVYEDQGEVLFDLVVHDRNGNNLGRVSPAMGGPRTFEPACSTEGWRRISRPVFPIEIKSIPIGNGRVTWKYWAGNTLPPANYVPRKRRGVIRAAEDDRLRKALQEIADGHNDPRALARSVLGKP